jgi:hypothetical protein
MKEILLTVELIFLGAAKENFNFPITNPVRTSFWLLNSEYSTFSEIQPKGKKIEVWQICQLEIKIVERDFLRGMLVKGGEFKLGTYPYEIAYGRIIEMSL